jgi:hypothetical protein
MHFVVYWSDAMTNNDYVRDPAFWSGAYSNIIFIDDNINFNVDHDFEILQNLKDKNDRETKHIGYIQMRKRHRQLLKYSHNYCSTARK